ncbi:MAG: hypothetical protein ABIU85_00630 [Methylotenera sp.]
MSHIALTSTEALHRFIPTLEQVNHIAVSLASDIGRAESLMSRDYLECHHKPMFLVYFNDQRIMGSVNLVKTHQ